MKVDQVLEKRKVPTFTQGEMDNPDGLICTELCSQKDRLKSHTLVSVNVIFFGNRIFAYGIKLN